MLTFQLRQRIGHPREKPKAQELMSAGAEPTSKGTAQRNGTVFPNLKLRHEDESWSLVLVYVSTILSRFLS